MTTVSNTSPLIALSSIGCIRLLYDLYGPVCIPEAVFNEITKENLPGHNEIISLDWIEKRTVKDRLKVHSLKTDLDEGESEAITLALELHADILLIDERKGKSIADNFLIKNIGVLGILLEAKNKKLIKHIKPLLDDLILKIGFWINKDIYEFVLQQAQEKK